MTNCQFEKVIIVIEYGYSYDELRYDRSYLEILYYIFQQRMTLLGNICIHGSAVVYEDEVILFCGASGIGKSTQSKMWEKYLGANVINYDKPMISIKNGIMYVEGTPWGGKENFRLSVIRPLRAIIYLGQEKYNRIKHLSLIESSAKMYANNLSFPINETITERYIFNISHFNDKIESYEYFCLPDESGIRDLYTFLFNDDYNYAKRRVRKMRISNMYKMRNIAGEYIVFPTGEDTIRNNNMILLNETGAFLWDLLKEDCTEERLLFALLNEYDIDEETAKRDVSLFLTNMKRNGVIFEGAE